MAKREQERAANALFIETIRLTHNVDLIIHVDNADNFPDFILFNGTTNESRWVEIVEAVESEELISAESRAQQPLRCRRPRISSPWRRSRPHRSGRAWENLTRDGAMRPVRDPFL